jgi:NodT family efflux transporter outer membrane factor (OMF) lipoprotein
MKLSTLITSLFFMLLLGCTKEAFYENPVIPSPLAFKENTDWVAVNGSQELIENNWWQLFNDPKLDQLESMLDDKNPNLAVYVARLEQAQAYTMNLKSEIVPNIDLIGQSTSNRESDKRPLRGKNLPDVYGANTLGLSLNYDPDFWGRIKGVVSAGESLEKASQYDLANARVSIQMLLASDYFELRRYDSQVNLYKQTIQSYDRQLKLTTNLHDQGVVSGLDVSRAFAQIENTKGFLFVAESNRAKYEHSIAVLVGESPSMFAISSAELGDLKYPDIPVMVPSTLLERRPDIASAESKLASANAAIGVAKTAYFPNINLGLAAGFQNTGSLGLLSAPNLFWALGPSAVLNLFDGGKRDAQVRVAVARRDELANAYKLTVLKGFKEVEDSLSLLDSINKQMVTAENAKSAVKHSNDLVMNRFFEGIVSSFEVVKANDDLLNANEILINTKINNVEARVALIYALGGGWTTH